MEKISFRPLQKDEILLRIDEIELPNTSVNGSFYMAIVIPYKDARVDMKILDETFGPMNWQRKHQIIDKKNYCTISIWDKDKGIWIEKMDVGTRQNFESEKAESSDSFKRAGFTWGIGRELYSIQGNLRVPLRKDEVVIGEDGNYHCTVKFRVGEIRYSNLNSENKEIEYMSIIDSSLNVRATYDGNVGNNKKTNI